MKKVVERKNQTQGRLGKEIEILLEQNDVRVLVKLVMSMDESC